MIVLLNSWLESNNEEEKKQVESPARIKSGVLVKGGGEATKHKQWFRERGGGMRRARGGGGVRCVQRTPDISSA